MQLSLVLARQREYYDYESTQYRVRYDFLKVIWNVILSNRLYPILLLIMAVRYVRNVFIVGVTVS